MKRIVPLRPLIDVPAAFRRFGRRVRRKVEHKSMQVLIASLLRHALTAGGFAGIVSGDEIGQAAGAISTLIGLAWSVIPKLIAARRAI